MYCELPWKSQKNFVVEVEARDDQAESVVKRKGPLGIKLHVRIEVAVAERAFNAARHADSRTPHCSFSFPSRTFQHAFVSQSEDYGSES